MQPFCRISTISVPKALTDTTQTVRQRQDAKKGKGTTGPVQTQMTKDPSPHLPAVDDRMALFLDFDGTLVPFAGHPDDIRLPTVLPDLLRDLSDALGGACALISGRSIDDIDRRLGYSRLAVAGEHGGQIRFPDGSVISRASVSFSAALKKARRAFRGHPGIVIEPKSAGFAVHYRQAPDLQGDVGAFMKNVIERRPDLEIIGGKFVFELRSRGVSKAAAIEEFMTRQPFEGRKPVFFGDDVTDEDGFRAVNALGGISIKVGDGRSCADLRAKTIDEVYEWLIAVRDHMENRQHMNRP